MLRIFSIWILPLLHNWFNLLSLSISGIHPRRSAIIAGMLILMYSFSENYAIWKYNINTTPDSEGYQTAEYDGLVTSVAKYLGELSNAAASLTEIQYEPIPEIAPAKQLELDLELPPEIDLYTMPEIVFERVANGELADPASAPNAVTDAEPAVDPSPSPDPDLPYVPPAFDEDNPPEDIDDLGLPDLGYALTTRFPFSIPWDIYRGLKLLKAPARTPKFSVDFFGPISGVVGGWKGSTELVIDFGYYPEMEMIGKICRWTSMLGYCLFLASATKRFIWTA